MTTNVNNAPVESWAVSEIKPYEFNHKKHPEKQIAMLARLIEAKGLINPLVLEEDGTIIAGHGRFLAIQRLNWAKVPVRVMRGISKEDASAMRIADNKTVSNDYDTDVLARELAQLSAADFDLGMIGFDQKEIDLLVGDPGEIDTDSLTQDIDAAVEKHEADVSERAEKADEDDVRLDKVFGFKTVPLRDQKHLSRFLAEIEAFTGQKGAEALVTFARGWTPNAA